MNDAPSATRSAPRRRASRFVLALLAITFAGLSLRIGILALRPVCPDTAKPLDVTTDECYFHNGDGFWYHTTANLIADQGAWFKTYDSSFALVETAQHPPLYTLYLAAWSKVGADSVDAHRIVSALLGATVIPLAGLVGRRARGDRAGLLAAGLAATYPMLWINEGQLLSEAIYAPVVAGVMLAGYRFHDRPTTRTAAILGATLGLAALTRQESVGLYAVMVVPLIWSHRELARSQQAALVGVAVAITGLLLAPWVAFNVSRFEERVVFGTGSGQSLRLTNCDATYYGEYLGYRHNSCWDLGKYSGLGYDESQLDAALRDEASTYIDDHRGRLPVVMAARVGRVWDLYAPRFNTYSNWLIDRRGRAASTTGQLLYFAMLPAAAAGVIEMRRRRVPVSPILGMAAIVTVGAALTFGLTRYRVAADVALVVAAGVGIDLALARWWPALRARLRPVR